MKENRIKEVMEEIRIPEEKKEEIWRDITRKADRGRYLRRKVVAAAAVILGLLLIPTGVYAAGGFSWIWEEVEEKNEQLNDSFKRETASVEAGGFLFRIEQAMCDDNMGIAYFYMSVTDVSGQGRNPAHYEDMTSYKHEVGDLVFSIRTKSGSSGVDRYDEKNSTEETAYYYIESEGWGKQDLKDMSKVEVMITEVEQPEDEWNGATGTVIETKTMTMENIIQMPFLTWKIKMGERTAEVRVSTVIAHVMDVPDPEFEIVMKDGTAIKDYFGFNLDECEDGRIPDENSFTSKGEGSDMIGAVYRFNYIDVDQISGIRLNGVFYSAAESSK